MAEQIPFDPGGPGYLNAENDKSEPPLQQPIIDLTRNSAYFEGLDVSRYRAIKHPLPLASAQNFGYAQYADVSLAPGQLVSPHSQVSYGLQTASYSQQAYNLFPTPPHSAPPHGSFGILYSPAPTDRRNSHPLRYHPYMHTTSGHASFDLHGRSPVRTNFGHPTASLYRTTSEAPQAAENQILTILSPPPKKVSGSKIPLRPSVQPPPPFRTLIAGSLAKEVLPTSKRPTDQAPESPSTYAGLNTPSHPVSAQTLSNNLGRSSQAKVIMSLAKPNAVITKSVCEVFSDEQCDKILWLALHGVPCRAIAYLLTFGSEAIKLPGGKLDKRAFIAMLSSVIQHFVPELAARQHGEENPEALVRHLLERGDSLYWSPFCLKNAIDYTFISDDDGDSADQERIRNAKERNAVPKWRANGEDPSEAVSRTGRKRRNSTKKMVALGGVLREASEQEIIEEHFGYRDGSHEVEEILMKKWLLMIRELGRLPDRSEVAQAQMTDDGLDETTAT